MAYGACVIGSDLPEIDGTLADTGPRFPARDADRLREQMALMLANPAQVHDYGRAARQRVIDHFNWDEVTNDYEQTLPKDFYFNLRVFMLTTLPPTSDGENEYAPAI